MRPCAHAGRPSVANFYINQAEQLLNMTRIMRPDTRTFPVLDSMSGVLKPVRVVCILVCWGGGGDCEFERLLVQHISCVHAVCLLV